MSRSPRECPTPLALESALRSRFGLSEFREGQREVVEAVLRGEDALVVRPTGSGKSLCYQLPALLSPGVTLVVSPLISLMKDQCDALAARGLPAVAIHSGLEWQAAADALSAVRSLRARICYVAPERFRASRFLEALHGLDVSILAIDEAHCVSEWGHEFRPDYRRLGAAREALGMPPVVALTATATARVRRDILDELKIAEASVFVSGFDRPNLHFEVEKHGKREEKLARLRELRGSLGAHGAAIVYCATRKSATEVAASLGGERKGVGLYHAGLEQGARKRVQEAFMRDALRVLVATNAFGMGIDRPDIRLVAHAEMPRSLEAYYQEAGRAGRDGQPARCVLLYGRADRIVHEYLIDESTPERELVERVWGALRPERGPGPRDGDDIESLAEQVTPRGPRGGGKPRTLATEAALKLLEKAGHVALGLDRETRSTKIEVRDATPRADLRIDWAMVTARRGFEKERLSRVGRYAESQGCRTRAILNYFGDRSPVAFHGKCEHCDGCGVSAPEIARVEPRKDEPATVARKLLSCVARMGAAAVRGHVSDCLRGVATFEAIARGHDKLSTFGLLKALPEAQVGGWIAALAGAGLLSSEGETILLTRPGVEVMAGRAPLPPLEGLPSAAPQPDARHAATASRDPDAPSAAHDEADAPDLREAEAREHPRPSQERAPA